MPDDTPPFFLPLTQAGALHVQSLQNPPAPCCLAMPSCNPAPALPVASDTPLRAADTDLADFPLASSLTATSEHPLHDAPPPIDCEVLDSWLEAAAAAAAAAAHPAPAAAAMPASQPLELPGLPAADQQAAMLTELAKLSDPDVQEIFRAAPSACAEAACSGRHQHACACQQEAPCACQPGGQYPLLHETSVKAENFLHAQAHGRQVIRGVLLLPCRTALRGRFPLAGALQNH